MSAFSNRIKRLRVAMEEAGADAAFFNVREEDSWRSNVFYYSGFTGSNAQLLITKRSVNFLTDSRYALQSSKEVRVANPIFYKNWAEMYEILRKVIREERIRKVGVDENELPLKLANLFQKSGAKPVEMFSAISKIRAIKSNEEINAIRGAIDVQTRSFKKILPMFKAGAVEKDIAAELEYNMKKLVYSKPSFDTIIASGPRGAMPHARASEKKFRKGELAVVDFGCFFKNYCSDETAVVSIGKSSAEQKEAHAIAREAQNRAFDLIRPGAKLKDIDAAARNFVKKSKFGRFAFGHGLGHGIGLKVHEWPSLSPTSDAIAERGMVFSIEPGIYVTGKFGVRVEDLVLVTHRSFKTLTKLPKDEILHA